MIHESYRCLVSNKKNRFLFESRGLQGRVMKVIVFSQIAGDLWNVSFGDLKKGQLDDESITNNRDIAKVLGTVAQAIIEFTAMYPERTIRIQPVDAKRKTLYNTIFQRRYSEIEEYFALTGILNDEREDYDPQKSYDSFEIIRRLEKSETERIK